MREWGQCDQGCFMTMPFSRHNDFVGIIIIANLLISIFMRKNMSEISKVVGSSASILNRAYDEALSIKDALAGAVMNMIEREQLKEKSFKDIHNERTLLDYKKRAGENELATAFASKVTAMALNTVRNLLSGQ